MKAFSSLQGLVCLTCGSHYEFSPMLGGCPSCQSAGRVAILDVVYAYDREDAASLREAGGGKLWDYHRLLPLPDADCLVTLGEGGSPLVPLETVAAETGAAEVWAKYEAINPTHSFKDRTNAVAVALAQYFGFEKVMSTSTGNLGVALAAYAARAGLRCVVLLPSSTPPVVEEEIQFFGSEVVTISSGDIVPLMAKLCTKHGWYISQRNAPGVGGRAFGNPFGLEGYKTISYEIFHQLEGRAPDCVFCPAGGGDGVWGIYKGFWELRQLGLATRIPRIVACQSTSGAPLVNAVRGELGQVAPVETAPTIAYSIVERQTGDHALLAVRRSGGTAEAVDDDELVAAEDTLRRVGICVEPSSAASLAGFRAQTLQGDSFEGETVVLIATGAGIRWPATFAPFSRPREAVAGNLRALESVIAL